MAFVVKKAKREKIYPKIALIAPSGGGKALTYDSLLMAENGYITMRDVKVGDRLYSDDGELHTVTGVYPQGVKRIYRVTFSDRTYVDCSEDHLWNVRKTGCGNYKTLPLSEIIANGIKDDNGRNKFFIPMTSPLKFEEKRLPIDPYTMGVMIANGFPRDREATFCTSDMEIIDLVENGLPNAMELHVHKHDNSATTITIVDLKNANNRYHESLAVLGVFEHDGSGRFIPNIYKTSSIKQRFELLAGLIDAGGRVYGIHNNCESGYFVYGTVSKRLAEDVKYIATTLGGTAVISKRTTYYNEDSDEGVESYRVTIKLPDGIYPFHVSRNRVNGYYVNEDVTRSIESVEYIGDKECQCISVDSPSHLFLTNDCIVTHNTYSALRLATGMAEEIKNETGKDAKILMLNTEAARGRYYANEFDYDIVDLEAPFEPELFVEAIEFAVAEKYDILVIDSTSPEWDGKGGCLELQQKAGGTYQAWSKHTCSYIQ